MIIDLIKHLRAYAYRIGSKRSTPSNLPRLIISVWMVLHACHAARATEYRPRIAALSCRAWCWNSSSGGVSISPADNNNNNKKSIFTDEIYRICGICFANNFLSLLWFHLTIQDANYHHCCGGGGEEDIAMYAIRYSMFMDMFRLSTCYAKA